MPTELSERHSQGDVVDESTAAGDLESHHIAGSADMRDGPDAAASALSSTHLDPTDRTAAPEDMGRSPQVGRAVEEAHELSVSPLLPHPSLGRSGDWRKALLGQDDALLEELVDSEPPGQALFELETYINGTYRACDITTNLACHDFPIQLEQEGKEDDNEDNHREMAGSEEQEKHHASVEERIEKVLDQGRKKVRRLELYIDRIRDQLGWDVREFDIQLLRAARRSSSLSPVLGAGVSAAEGCRAPSWPALVQELLEVTLERGLQVNLPRPEDVASLPPLGEQLEVLPRDPAAAGAADVDQPSEAGEPADDAGSTGIRTVKFENTKLKEYNEGEKQRAQQIIDTIKSGQADNNLLMEGAELVYSLAGQHLFTLMTGILYRNNRKPSVIHRAIARLAHPQYVLDRQPPGTLPGWDTIITYNFDAFMSEALLSEGVASAAWGMRGNQLMGDPNSLALRLGQVSWIQSVLHLHGYTPPRLFNITHVRFVFAASQYKDTYHQPSSAIFRKVLEEYLENPVHIALYIGCSFTDEYMNRLLRMAFEKWPRRYHYALLRWPKKREGRVPDEAERKAEEKKYLDMGVRPIWFDEFAEIPHIIARLE